MNAETMRLILVTHERWLCSGREGSGRAVLCHVDLRGKDLSRVNLGWADLRDANLRDAKLIDADLSHADLRGADLRGADLRGCVLDHAELSGVRVEAVLLNKSPWNHDLLECEVRDAFCLKGKFSTAEMPEMTFYFGVGEVKL